MKKKFDEALIRVLQEGNPWALFEEVLDATSDDNKSEAWDFVERYMVVLDGYPLALRRDTDNEVWNRFAEGVYVTNIISNRMGWEQYRLEKEGLGGEGKWR